MMGLERGVVYLPVLRWKAAERTALCHLTSEIRRAICPIFEIVPLSFKDKSPEAVVRVLPRQIGENWGVTNHAFVDFSLLKEELAASLIPSFNRYAAGYGLNIGWVVRPFGPLSINSAIERAIDTEPRELCLRLKPQDLVSPDLNSSIEALLSHFGCSAPDVHLVLDFEILDHRMSPSTAMIGTLPLFTAWRTVTFLGGGFPKDLSALRKNEEHMIPRSEWLLWMREAGSVGGRNTFFGDYTIQHGIFEEREGKSFNFSASIRYTTHESWLIMRGEGVRNENGPGYAQWPAWAQLLSDRDEFCGPQFSFGDEYIHSMGRQFVKTGGPQEWLAATVNHHLTFVARQCLNPFSN